MTASLTPLVVTVTSDNICPFCYIGLKKLEAALSASALTSPESSARLFEPQIRFLPFELDASLPRDKPLDKRERYNAKFGPRWTQMEQMMVARGKEVGINFDYSGPVRSTFLSHRLMEKAYQQGGYKQQRALLGLLFPAYFEQRQDPGSPDVLADLAVRAGVFPDTAAARAFLLDSDECAADVMKGFALARTKSISGVPHFEITAAGARTEVPGAQDSDTFQAVFKQLASKVGGQVGAAQGNSC